MVDIAIHIRILNAEPSDDFVEKRTNAIQDLSKAFAKRRTVPDILQLANDLSAAVATKGILPTALASEVEVAIKEYSPAFVQTGHELETIVCALLAALQYLESARPSKGPLLKPDILAAGLWSALSFQPTRTEAKLEALRAEILARSQSMIITTSSSARNRSEVPNFSYEVPETPDWVSYSESLIKGASKTIKALRDNSALDREELDLLWWVLSDWSSLLNETLSASPPEAAAIGRGIEVARLLRRLPGDAHKHLVLKGIVNGESLALSNLIKTLGDNRTKLASAFQGDTTVEACPAVFPLLLALLTGRASGSGVKVTRSLHEWAARALLESVILHVTSIPNPPEI